MTVKKENYDEVACALPVDKGVFEMGSLEDELRVDALSYDLLKQFYLYLLNNGNAPAQATEIVNGADYFIRDFVVACRQQNIFFEKPGTIRQFAGNWYIVSNIEPDIKLLSMYLTGILSFYQYLHGLNLISDSHMEQVIRECSETAYYEGRIDSFWKIEGDGYTAWEKECTLKSD